LQTHKSKLNPQNPNSAVHLSYHISFNIELKSSQVTGLQHVQKAPQS